MGGWGRRRRREKEGDEEGELEPGGNEEDGREGEDTRRGFEAKGKRGRRGGREVRRVPGEKWRGEGKDRRKGNGSRGGERRWGVTGTCRPARDSMQTRYRRTF